MRVRSVISLATIVFSLLISSLMVMASDLPLRGQPKGKPVIKIGDKVPLPTPELEKAHKEGKAIILMLGYPPHCNWCDRMDRIIYETLPHYKDEVVFIQKQVERVRFLAPDKDGIKLKKAYGTTGQPWLFIIDKEGIVRYIYPLWVYQNQLIDALNTILERKASASNPYPLKAQNGSAAKGGTEDVKEFILTVTEGTIVLNRVKFPIWTFNGTIPGPEIRVKEGDKVRIRLMNKSKAKHSLMFHGLHVPFKVLLKEEEPVPPGYEYTYEFIAKPSGTHLYHCNFNMAEHLDKGLYGAFIVEEKNREKTDKEFTYILDEWNSKQAKGHSHHTTGHPRTIGDYDIVTINGKVATEKIPVIMEVKREERVRTRILNVGYLPHTLRFPDGFIITHEDGYPLPIVRRESSLTIMPGKRYDLFLTMAGEGRWPFYHSIKLPRPSFREAKTHQPDIVHRKEEATLILDVK